MTYSCYSFGKYILRICSEKVINTSFLTRLEPFTIGAMPEKDVYIDLELDDRFIQGAFVPGWSFVTLDSAQLVSYSNERSLVFQMQYSMDDRSKITIHVDVNNAMSTSLSIQHALMLALSDRCIGLHGVTVICGSIAVILSAPSGTGKTTLSRLLQKYCDVAVVNGDFALLEPTVDAKVIFEPTAFCGSSGICHNYRFPISGIVFLEQGNEPQIRPLVSREALKLMLSNIFIPQWDGELELSLKLLAIKVIENVQICKFSFPPTEESANMLFSYIENWNDVPMI